MDGSFDIHSLIPGAYEPLKAAVAPVSSCGDTHNLCHDSFASTEHMLKILT